MWMLLKGLSKVNANWGYLNSGINNSSSSKHNSIMTFSDIKMYTFWSARSRVLKCIVFNYVPQITSMLVLIIDKGDDENNDDQ